MAPAGKVHFMGRDASSLSAQPFKSMSAAVVFILGWLMVANPERGLAYVWVLGSAAFFLVTGLVQFWLYFRGRALRLAAYLFILVDSLALAAVLLLPNPYAEPALPPAIPLRFASFMYFFVFLRRVRSGPGCSCGPDCARSAPGRRASSGS
jgi:hypothetical protein